MRSKDFEPKDNWFEEERRREARVSAWDLDNASTLRSEHEENCEREQVEKEHAIEHSRREVYQRYEPGERDGLRKGVSLMSICFIGLFVNWFMMFANQNIFPNVINFLLINPGIFIILLFTKGRPYKARIYWLCVLLYEIILCYKNVTLLFG